MVTHVMIVGQPIILHSSIHTSLAQRKNSGNKISYFFVVKKQLDIARDNSVWALNRHRSKSIEKYIDNHIIWI
jgi:hypothetical protein